MEQTSPAFTPCLRWKCWSAFWLTVRHTEMWSPVVMHTALTYQIDTRHCFVCVNMNAMFHSFWGEFRRMDRSLETSIVANCRVVWWLASNSDTVAPVSASTQPDRCGTLRQGRQEGGKSLVCASLMWKHAWNLIITSQRILSNQYWISAD